MDLNWKQAILFAFAFLLFAGTALQAEASSGVEATEDISPEVLLAQLVDENDLLTFLDGTVVDQMSCARCIDDTPVRLLQIRDSSAGAYLAVQGENNYENRIEPTKRVFEHGRKLGLPCWELFGFHDASTYGKKLSAVLVPDRQGFLMQLAIPHFVAYSYIVKALSSVIPQGFPLPKMPYTALFTKFSS